MNDGFQHIQNSHVTTIFSAHNYCYRYGNLTAIKKVDGNLECTHMQFDPIPRRGEGNLGKKTPDYIL